MPWTWMVTARRGGRPTPTPWHRLASFPHHPNLIPRLTQPQFRLSLSFLGHHRFHAKILKLRLVVLLCFKNNPTVIVILSVCSMYDFFKSNHDNSDQSSPNIILHAGHLTYLIPMG